MGRWVSRDPLGERGGINLYGFCTNDPFNIFDFLGLTDPYKFGSCTRCHVMNYEATGYGDPNVGGILVGVVTGAGKAVVGTFEAAAHPVQTTEALIHAAGNPSQTIEAIAEHYSEKAQTYTGRGEITFDVLAVFVTVVKVKQIIDIAKTSNLTKVEKKCKIKAILKPEDLHKVDDIAPTSIPQGLSQAQFDEAASLLRTKAGHIGDDISVHGSRASGTVQASSDIDFAIRVSPEQFDTLIKTRFGNPNPDSAKFRTMQHAIETGKIQAGEAGLRGVRRQIQNQLGMKVDLSVIKIGGGFDKGPYIPIP